MTREGATVKGLGAVGSIAALRFPRLPRSGAGLLTVPVLTGHAHREERGVVVEPFTERAEEVGERRHGSGRRNGARLRAKSRSASSP